MAIYRPPTIMYSKVSVIRLGCCGNISCRRSCRRDGVFISITNSLEQELYGY